MKFRIHFEQPDGTEDSFIVSGETIEDIRDKANAELFSRIPGIISTDAWSEELKES